MAAKIIWTKKLSAANFTLDPLLEYCRDVMTNLGRVDQSTVDAYYNNYLPGLDKANGGQTCKWLMDIINSKSITPVKDAMDKFDKASSSFKVTQNTITDWKTAYRHFAHNVLGFYYAEVWFAYTVDPVALCKMVAMNTLFPSREVVDGVKSGKYGTKQNIGKGNVYASWDNCTSQRDISVKKGRTLPNGKIADDNTFANRYIKRAIQLSMNIPKTPLRFINYQVCHIWESSVYPDYHASIMNIVLVFNGLAGLTDYVPEVQELLRYEAYKRFGLSPSGVPISMPPFYNKIVWRN